MTNTSSSKPGSTKTRRRVRKLFRILLIVPIILLLMMPAGAIFQAVYTYIDNQVYPPPGEMVDIGGIRLHIYCEGEGSPTVVFEAGMGNSGYTFINILKEITGHTRACLYDRPDLGWSDSADQMLVGDVIPRNLHTLLDLAGEHPPYIMVGHSAGGVYIRAFHRLFPGEVVGLVLVDSALENQNSYYPPPENADPEFFQTMMDFCEFIAGVSILRATGVMANLIDDTPLTASEQRRLASRLNRVSYCRGIRNEKESTDIDLDQPNPAKSLGALPIIVLSGAKDLNPIRNKFYLGPLPPAQRQNTIIWQEIQKELVALSGNSKQVLALKSGHYIYWDEPDLVIEAIISMLDEVRSSSAQN